tara:strand:- start:287 stop:673 length:387 start_codon:yes stop_codon:yes gene_type:complete
VDISIANEATAQKYLVLYSIVEFKIEKNVPLPKEAHEKYLDKFWNKMQIGDSILLSHKECKNLRQALRLFLKDEAYGLYKTRKEGDFHRLWKIKERGKKSERKYTEGTIRTYQYKKPKLSSVESNGKN